MFKDDPFTANNPSKNDDESNDEGDDESNIDSPENQDETKQEDDRQKKIIATNSLMWENQARYALMQIYSQAIEKSNVSPSTLCAALRQSTQKTQQLPLSGTLAQSKDGVIVIRLDALSNRNIEVGDTVELENETTGTCTHVTNLGNHVFQVVIQWNGSSLKFENQVPVQITPFQITTPNSTCINKTIPEILEEYMTNHAKASELLLDVAIETDIRWFQYILDEESRTQQIQTIANYLKEMELEQCPMPRELVDGVCIDPSPADIPDFKTYAKELAKLQEKLEMLTMQPEYVKKLCMSFFIKENDYEKLRRENVAMWNRMQSENPQLAQMMHYWIKLMLSHFKQEFQSMYNIKGKVDNDNTIALGWLEFFIATPVLFAKGTNILATHISQTTEVFKKNLPRFVTHFLEVIRFSLSVFISKSVAEQNPRLLAILEKRLLAVSQTVQRSMKKYN